MGDAAIGLTVPARAPIGRDSTASRSPAGRLAPSRTPDFEALIGRAAWRRLPQAVRVRFALHTGASTDVTTYRGAMQVRASMLGRCIAQLCRLAGTPVAPFVHESVPVTVRVFERPDRGGTVWERRYDFPGRPAVVVSSTKQLDVDGSLIEALGAGLRMRLDVFESDGALHFLSTGYYFQLGRWQIPLPAGCRRARRTWCTRIVAAGTSAS